MRASLERRLAALDAELRRGAALLSEQEAAVARTRATLNRIEGAAQVLRELCAEVGEGAPAEPPP